MNIRGSTFVPPIPMEYEVKQNIDRIIHAGGREIDEVIELLLYCMKIQAFIDVNKKSSVIFANHFMVQDDLCLVVVPESVVAEFKLLLQGSGRDKTVFKGKMLS